MLHLIWESFDQYGPSNLMAIKLQANKFCIYCFFHVLTKLLQPTYCEQCSNVWEFRKWIFCSICNVVHFEPDFMAWCIMNHSNTTSVLSSLRFGVAYFSCRYHDNSFNAKLDILVEGAHFVCLFCEVNYVTWCYIHVVTHTDICGYQMCWMTEPMNQFGDSVT